MLRADEPSIPIIASAQDGTYPRPQMIRREWTDLSGQWDFAFDDADVGRREHWQRGAAKPFPHTITVPFPPESPASGIGDPSFHSVVWYRRSISPAEVACGGRHVGEERVLLHFGAVDYRADVWLAGQHLGHHEGGQTPFAFDITDVAGFGTKALSLVVRAEDDPLDVEQPRGKQDWQAEPHGVWYDRTTGIWQPVWLEVVPAVHVTRLSWQPDVPAGTVTLGIELNRRPAEPVTVGVRLEFDGEPLAELSFPQSDPRSVTRITLPNQTNGQAQESLLWSPESPRLIDATVRVTAAMHSDVVASYFGLRSVGWADGHFLLNDRPCYVRSVLCQGYWPTTHLAAPCADALRREVQLVRDLGFNSARVHQKVEDPRFLFWADRLGVLVWGENASAFAFSPTAVSRMAREWADVVCRDRSHPSVVTWVPLNESWGAQHIAHDPAQLDYARALYHLTKALDPTRPVVSNDGWEHAHSDIWTIHDYSATPTELAVSYTSTDVVTEMMGGLGPLGRRMRLVEDDDRNKPVIVSEFGGVSYQPVSLNGDTWGYVTTLDADGFETALRGLFEALQSSPVLAGFCYTQLTDTRQEANGLVGPDRRPKIAIEKIRDIVLGHDVDTSTQRRPRRPVEIVNTFVGRPRA